MQKLWIPGRLPGLNEIIEGSSGSGKATAREWNHQKRNWEHQIGLLAHVQGIKKIEPAYFSYVFVEPNRKRDPSNFSAGAVKIIEDALQSAGLLENDGWRHVLGISKSWFLDKELFGVCLIIEDRPLASQYARDITRSYALSLKEKGLYGKVAPATSDHRHVGVDGSGPPGDVRDAGAGRARRPRSRQGDGKAQAP